MSAPDDRQMLDAARAVAAYASSHGIGDSLAVVHLAEHYERMRDALVRIANPMAPLSQDDMDIAIRALAPASTSEGGR